MNSFFFFFFLLLSAATHLIIGAYAAPEDTADILSEWNHYKSLHHKHYSTPEEDNRRLQVYLATKKYVQEHNSEYEQGRASFTMAINKFADWYPEELAELNGLKVDENRPQRNLFRLEPGEKVPDSMDWVKKGAVTPVKEQLFCGSDYAFSAVGAIEGLMFRTNKTIQSLSAQEILDCSQPYGNHGCRDGNLDFSFSYVVHRGGVDSDKSYKYTGTEGKCQATKGVIVASCKDFVDIPKKNEMALKEAVGTVGPVSIMFAAGKDFLNYRGGIFDRHCSVALNHAMLLVGYDRDNRTKKDYWVVKNSWGTNWGEKGYARIVMGQNKCGLASLASYPIS